MGSFSLWHWLIVLVMVGVPALIVAGIIWLIVRASRGGSNRQAAQPRISPMSNTEVRLAELAALLRAGHITQEEYERQRAAVIASV